MPLRIYKRGEIWHYRGTVAGRRLRGSTKTADKITALRITAEKEAKQWKGHLDGPGSVLTFAQAALLYLDSRKSARFVARVCGYWRDTPIKQITSGAIRASAQKLYQIGSPATWNRQVITVTQAIINHAAEQELCPRIKVKRFPVIKTEKTPASWPWVQAFMSTSSSHLGALACFMFLTGARISEALSLTWGSLDITSSRALIRSPKIGEERWAHLPPELVAALANIPGDRVGKVFPWRTSQNARRPWMAAIARAGIKPLTPHALRHGFATGLLDKGVNPKTVAKRGGWKSTAHVFATYGHDVASANVTDILTDTPETQHEVISANKRQKF